MNFLIFIWKSQKIIWNAKKNNIFSYINAYNTGRNEKLSTSNYEDDDELIKTLILSAQRICMDILRTKDSSVLYNIENSKPAVMYTVAYLYEHQEEADHHALTITLSSLLFGSRKEVFWWISSYSMSASTPRRVKSSQIQSEIKRTLENITTPAMPSLVPKPERNPPMLALS